MKNNESVYLEAIKLIINSNDNKPQDLVITFKYKNINFFPPKIIGDTKIIYLSNPDKQFDQLAHHGVLRFLEIEPVDIVNNYVQLKINSSLSLKSDINNYDLMLKNLSSIEKKVLLSITDLDKKSIDLFINIESHIFDFGYDCDQSSFFLSNHKKLLSI